MAISENRAAEKAVGSDHSISVIVVNYNAGPLLAECIKSVFGQCDEVIVVDNASSDTSLLLLQETLATTPFLHVIRNDRNLGFAAACNIGASHASSRHLLFLNPDCLLDSGALAKLFDALHSDTQVGMVGGLLINPDGSEQGGGRRAIPTPWRSLVRALGLNCFAQRWPRLFFDFHLHKQPLPKQPVEVEAISGACMLVPKSIMEEIGPWDEGYFLHCEDLDWCLRLTRTNKKILFVPDARILHYKGICSHDRAIFVEWHKHKGMLRFYRKFFRDQYPGGLMWLVGAGIWLRFTLIAVYFSMRDAGRLLGQMRG
ncbi:MAG: glycosyltransferase family 2 protein [Methylobacter sp.]